MHKMVGNAQILNENSIMYFIQFYSAVQLKKKKTIHLDKYITHDKK